MYSDIALLASLLLLVISTGRNVLCFPLGTPFLNSQCVPFKSRTCNTLGLSGYDHTPFPHPLSPDYVYSIGVLERVANEIIERTIASGCSPHAAEFLCFTYFPFCSADKPGVRPVVPCKSLCESVRDDCRSENGVTWFPWDCDLIGNYSVDSLCVDINDANVVSTTTAAGAPNGTNSGQLECANCSASIGLLSPNSTFWSQTCATVSKVSVTSRLVLNGTVAYNVTVDVTYVPKPCAANNVQGPTFATLLSATARSPSCTCPDMEVGDSYLVSDYQVLGASSGNFVPTWRLTAEGTVALWSNSYDDILASGTASGRNSSDSTSCL